MDCTRPMVANVIFRLDVGGLENGLVNIVNRMPAERYQHSIICIDKSTSFAERIARKDVQVFSMHKKPGRDWRASKRLYDLFRKLRPTIVHTRNLGALDALLPAFLAGVPVRIHGEHGLDVSDLHVSKLKYRILRKIHSPLVTHYIALSRQLSHYLQQNVGIDRRRITEIPNGVDIERFRPQTRKHAYRERLVPGLASDSIVIGSVGRLEAVKDPMNLMEAVAIVCNKNPELRNRIILIVVGDGSLKNEVAAHAERHGLSGRLHLTGMRNDVPDILAALDIFVSPSLAEGFSNTILEAMACGIPVIATDVGENAGLVSNGKSGIIVPPGRPDALAVAIAEYCRTPERIREDGANARLRIESEFGIERMVANYQCVYDRCVGNLEK